MEVQDDGEDDDDDDDDDDIYGRTVMALRVKKPHHPKLPSDDVQIKRRSPAFIRQVDISNRLPEENRNVKIIFMSGYSGIGCVKREEIQYPMDGLSYPNGQKTRNTQIKERFGWVPKNDSVKIMQCEK
ncbi:hypothetical protein M0802_002822 [Mischocyttarus mexicanus]|nr:hypothetical protein M0802_002822 [Mischocyttarus mexicanus]